MTVLAKLIAFFSSSYTQSVIESVFTKPFVFCKLRKLQKNSDIDQSSLDFTVSNQNYRKVRKRDWTSIGFVVQLYRFLVKNKSVAMLPDTWKTILNMWWKRTIHFTHFDSRQVVAFYNQKKTSVPLCVFENAVVMRKIILNPERISLWHPILQCANNIANRHFYF